MKENYQSALNHVLQSEGLWSDNPADPGGATMKGITLATYRSVKGNPHISKEDLRNISDQEVSDIYKQNYWDKIKGDDLPSGVDYAVFDASVNMGVGRALKLIQTAVGVPADGVIGNQTLQAIKNANPIELINKFSAEKDAFYKSLPTFGTFGKGWLNRVAQVKTTSESMIA
jgi:lysozyme family protein